VKSCGDQCATSSEVSHCIVALSGKIIRIDDDPLTLFVGVPARTGEEGGRGYVGLAGLGRGSAIWRLIPFALLRLRGRGRYRIADRTGLTKSHHKGTEWSTCSAMLTVRRQTVRPRPGYQLPDSLAVVILNGLGMVGLFTVSNMR
jgi:hypothetical protein